MPQFLYLMSDTVYKKYNKDDSNLTVRYNIKRPKKPTGSDIKLNVKCITWYKVSKYVINYSKKRNRSPRYVTISGKKLQYESAIFYLSSYLSKTKVEGNLPNSLNVSSKRKDPINNKGLTLVLFSGYKSGTAKNYLKSSKQAQSNNPTLRKLAKRITKGYKTKWRKAEAILNWTLDNVEYEYYYNTKYGAVKAIRLGRGNCVDQSHVVVALARANGIPARYVHSTCKFVSTGRTIGHVWTQLLIGHKWVVADPSNSRNRLGAVLSWNVNSYKRHGVYSSLSF